MIDKHALYLFLSINLTFLLLLVPLSLFFEFRRATTYVIYATIALTLCNVLVVTLVIAFLTRTTSSSSD